MPRRVANGARIRSPRSGVRSRFPFALFAFCLFPPRPPCKRYAALTAELKARRVFKAALRTTVIELHPALTAEFHFGGIVEAAARALHVNLPLPPAPCASAVALRFSPSLRRDFVDQSPRRIAPAQRRPLAFHPSHRLGPSPVH